MAFTVNKKAFCSTKKKLGEILYLLICSFLPCLSWLLRSRVRKSRRDLWITLYIAVFVVYLLCFFGMASKFLFRPLFTLLLSCCHQSLAALSYISCSTFVLSLYINSGIWASLLRVLPFAWHSVRWYCYIYQYARFLFFFNYDIWLFCHNCPICAPDCITLTLSYSHTLLLLLLLLLFYPPERCKWDARDVINSFMIFVFVLRNPKISTHGTRKCSDHCSISHWCARYEYIAKILPSLQNWRARQNVVTIMTVN